MEKTGNDSNDVKYKTILLRQFCDAVKDRIALVISTHEMVTNSLAIKRTEQLCRTYPLKILETLNPSLYVKKMIHVIQQFTSSDKFVNIAPAHGDNIVDVNLRSKRRRQRKNNNVDEKRRKSTFEFDDIRQAYDEMAAIKDFEELRPAFAQSAGIRRCFILNRHRNVFLSVEGNHLENNYASSMDSRSLAAPDFVDLFEKHMVAINVLGMEKKCSVVYDAEFPDEVQRAAVFNLFMLVKTSNGKLAQNMDIRLSFVGEKDTFTVQMGAAIIRQNGYNYQRIIMVYDTSIFPVEGNVIKAGHWLFAFREIFNVKLVGEESRQFWRFLDAFGNIRSPSTRIVAADEDLLALLKAKVLEGTRQKLGTPLHLPSTQETPNVQRARLQQMSSPTTPNIANTRKFAVLKQVLESLFWHSSFHVVSRFSDGKLESRLALQNASAKTEFS
uniref:Uncharacterized protein n=1 Tax=Panagrolaimus sp. JU765 TaxID=591449 RepID=A0AC34RK08_9BILA